MKDLLENIVLLLLTALLVMGVYNYCKSNEESKDENPIVDVLPGDDEEQEPGDEEDGIFTFNLRYSGYDFIFQAEEGMTWAEWLQSDYYLNNKTNAEGKTLSASDSNGYLYLRIDAGQKTTTTSTSDVISNDSYSF